MAKKDKKARAVQLEDRQPNRKRAQRGKEDDTFREVPLPEEPAAEEPAGAGSGDPLGSARLGNSEAAPPAQDAASLEELPPGAPAAEEPAGVEGTTSGLRRRKILIDGEIYYVVEADLAVDEDELALYEEQRAAQRAMHEALRVAGQAGFGEATIRDFGSQTSSLVGIVQDGKIVRWPPGTVISYCVLANTFPRQDWYDEVAENMQLATADWEGTCGVRFEYRNDLDNSDSLRPPGVLFPVRLINAGGAFIAAAFFPNDVVSRRRLFVDPSYFRTRFDHVGVLRHELGHTLGFRHEQLRPEAPPQCPDEDPTGTLDLTLYDPKSVMHYFCGGVGSRELAITDVDREGSQLLYGPPLYAFEFAAV
jgi:hypothetical protein